MTRPLLHPEQLRRSRQIWILAQPEPDEIRAAYRRWSSLAVESNHRRARPAWVLVAATLFVGGGAFAFASAVRHSAPVIEAAPPSASIHAPAVKLPRKLEHRAPQPVAVEDPAPTLEAESDIVARAPAVARSNSQPSRSVPGPKTANHFTGDVGSWSSVAEAMRQGDAPRVGKALEELSHSSDAATRDAARLTRAQLDIAAGHPEQARAALGELASSGATPLVRHRASEMLQRLSE